MVNPKNRPIKKVLVIFLCCAYSKVNRMLRDKSKVNNVSEINKSEWEIAKGYKAQAMPEQKLANLFLDNLSEIRKIIKQVSPCIKICANFTASRLLLVKKYIEAIKNEYIG